MTEREPVDSPALARLTELLRDAAPAPTPAELERSFAKVRSRLAVRRALPRAQRSWAWRGAIAVVCVALIAVTTHWLRSGSPPPLKPVAVSRVEGGQLLQGGYLSESSAEGVRLFFDEGSQLALTPGGRGRLRVDNGVRLLLERGSASLQITPTPEPRWVVESGPFLVMVKGTDFTVGWDPTSELFELTLRRGRVVVSGPLVGDGFVLRPGQNLRVSLPKAETVITEERPAALASAAPSTPAPAAAGTPAAPAATDVARPSDAAVAPAPSASAQRQWRRALASGAWDRIIAEAERDGIEASLEAASSDDLFALADAAHYRRRLDLAQAALLAQRRRFPSSSRATEAIFLLGRVSELRPGGRAAALLRFDEYLARAPTGVYAAEALGRKMTLVNESGGSARAIAQEYVQRFPNGSYAGAARALLSVEE